VRKFLAVVKREYIQRVRAKMFVFVTILAPLITSFFGLAPALIFNIRSGGPVRIAVVDQTGKLFKGLEKVLIDNGDESAATTNSNQSTNVNASDRVAQLPNRDDQRFELVETNPSGRDLSDIRKELDAKTRGGELGGYLVLPPDTLDGGRAEFFGRNTSDVFTRRRLQGALNRAAQERRLGDAHINLRQIQELSQPVPLDSIRIGETADEKDSGEGLALIFTAAFVMYISILMYGQVVLGAIIEEKETRIAEILFSSVRPFTLMIGKLVGVSLVALTQLAIWGMAFFVFTLFGLRSLSARGLPARIPNVPLSYFIYFIMFFLLGYFIYSTLYALVGSMVSTAQEGGQLAMPILLLLVVGFLFFVPVSRSPDSSFSFWVSMVPVFAPVTMLVRIVTQTPPFWQIALSYVIGLVTIAFIMWVAGRVYRVGMLMQGKRATIPEVWRWVRQA
jgi:ABC-2 type transport system permease protein